MKEEITQEIRKYFEWAKNENTMYTNLWDVAEVVLRATYITKEVLKSVI